MSVMRAWVIIQVFGGRGVKSSACANWVAVWIHTAGGHRPSVRSWCIHSALAEKTSFSYVILEQGLRVFHVGLGLDVCPRWEIQTGQTGSRAEVSPQRKLWDDTGDSTASFTQASDWRAVQGGRVLLFIVCQTKWQTESKVCCPVAKCICILLKRKFISPFMFSALKKKCFWSE